MVKIFHDSDVDESILKGKIVAVIGYGNQGSAQALCMKDSDIHVIIGSIKGKAYNKAITDNFEVMSISEAADKADIIHMLLPDEIHGQIFKNNIAKHMKKGKVFSCSHGFSIVYKQILPPEDIDVIMVAPKGVATKVRETFLTGFGVPGLIAVHQNPSGKAKDFGLAMAKAMGFTRAGCLECTFEQETYEDLFAEQNVICGGCVDLMITGFEVLTEAGYPPEMAYFECVHELKLIVDLISKGGIQKMNEIISNTAEYGEYYNGPKIITSDVKARMKESLKRIESGEFAQKLIDENRKGIPTLIAKRKYLAEHLIEKTGKRIRDMFEKK